MFTFIKKLYTRTLKIIHILQFAYRKREPIIAVVDDFEDVQKLCAELQEATDSTRAQRILNELLSLKAVQVVVQSTETKTDDLWLERTRLFVNDATVFNIAWRILHDDWSFRVAPSVERPFLNRMKKILPFSRNQVEVSSAIGTAHVQTDAQVEGILEVVSIIQLLMVLIPKIRAIFQNSRI